MFRKFQWVGLCFILTIACVPAIYAQDWIAATGAIDPASVSKATVSNGAVYVKPSSTATNTVIIRYDILPAGSNAKPLRSPDGSSSALREVAVRYIDSGSHGHVVVKMRKQNNTTGAISTLCTWDSNSWPASGNFQVFGGCEVYEDFDWNLPGITNSRYSYWLEATLTQAPGGTAALGGLSIFYDVP